MHGEVDETIAAADAGSGEGDELVNITGRIEETAGDAVIEPVPAGAFARRLREVFDENAELTRVRRMGEDAKVGTRLKTVRLGLFQADPQLFTGEADALTRWGGPNGGLF
jgi:hypothetical protein